MTCSEIKELTVPYLELDLEPSRVRDVTTHLEGCADCRAEMEAVRQVLVRVRGMAVPDPGDQFWREFPHGVRRELERLQGSATTPSGPSRFRRFWGEGVTAKWTLALAASLLLVVGAWLLRGQFGEVSAPFFQTTAKTESTRPPSLPGQERPGASRTGEPVQASGADLPTVAEAEWHDYWDVDPDAPLVEMATQLDRETMERLFADI